MMELPPSELHGKERRKEKKGICKDGKNR